jgi:hypothetical protein
MSVLVVSAVGLVACGDDDDDGPDAITTEAGTVPVAASIPGTNIVTVVATDYKFSELPAEVPAGTKFALQNDSTAEAHEMIVIRIPDDEKRTIGQLAALPEAESDAVFAGVEPSTVIVALPGETGQAVEGDGTVTEPGRYAVVCFIPKGADPDVLAEAMSNTAATGPPDMGTGPPHITQGMYAETVVK